MNRMFPLGSEEDESGSYVILLRRFLMFCIVSSVVCPVVGLYVVLLWYSSTVP